MDERAAKNRRSLLLWRTLAEAMGSERARELDPAATEIVVEAGLPPLLLDARPSVAQVVRRHPELAAELEDVVPDAEGPVDAASLRRTALFSKLLLNVFAPGAGDGQIEASQYSQWIEDVGAFEKALGYPPGELMGGAPASGRSSGAPSPAGVDTPASGGGPEVTDEDLALALGEIRRGRGLMSEPEIKAGLSGMEKRLVNRMALHEVLKDRALAEKLTPSMALTEQLLRQKGRLEGEALRNAKRLIRRFVDQLADLLKKEVVSAPKGKVDTSIPPKRVFRNLDLKKTIRRNLTNWDPDEQRLLVDGLYDRRTATKKQNTRLIVVVDQSGSMVHAMVNCTILASIFAGLPRVEAYLYAFDTEVVDLSPWVDDPFEALLRTQLGGGNDGPKAMRAAAARIQDPRKTVMVWISDFYEFQNDKPLFAMIEAVKQSGVTFIPVGSVSSGGYFNVNPWFRQKLESIGTPVVSGSLRTLVRELKSALPV